VGQGTVALLLLVGSAPALSAQYADIDSYSAATNARYENDPSFIVGNSLSGLGRSINTSFGSWGTLVSPNVFISANHWSPAVGHSLTFFASNDPSGPSITRTVIASRQLGNSDIQVGVLDFSLPSEYQPFPFFNTPITSLIDFESSALLDGDVFMVKRDTDASFQLENVAVGKNITEHWMAPNTISGIDQPLLIAVDDPSSSSFWVQYESILQLYDSGAPVLLELNGELTVIGLNWYRFENLSIDWRKGRPTRLNASGFSLVGDQAAGIQAAIDGFSIDATAGYVTWMSLAFAGNDDWSETGPAIDFDLDGLNNFTEYAFVLNPQDPTSVSPVISGSIEIASESYGTLQVILREDPQLLYSVKKSTDLSGGTSVDLSYSGGTWSSLDPGSVVIHDQVDNGDGTWSLTLRATDALAAGQPAFLLLQALAVPQ
jgi:hypothetical protein